MAAMPDDRKPEDGIWTECWQCGGVGLLAGCFEDTCSCMGDPEDPEDCCSPRRCDICRGKGSYFISSEERDNG